MKDVARKGIFRQLKIEKSGALYNSGEDKDYGDPLCVRVVEAMTPEKGLSGHFKISFHVERFEHRLSLSPPFWFEPLDKPLVYPDRFPASRHVSYR